jgi:hypothetical protein
MAARFRVDVHFLQEAHSWWRSFLRGRDVNRALKNKKSRIRQGCGFINHETSFPSLPYAGITQVRL